METTNIDQIVKNAQEAYKEEDFEAAASLFEQARVAYMAENDAVNAAEMSNNRSVALLRFGKAEDALKAALDTDQVFANAGDVRRQAMALGNQAAAWEAMSKLEEATQAYQQSNELLKQTQNNDLRIYILQSLSGIHLRRRQYFEAMATMQAALDLKPRLGLRERLLRWLLNVVFRMLGRG